MLIGLVPEAENDIFETVELTAAVAELECFVLQVLHQLNGVVRGFTLSISSHDEEDSRVFRELVQVLEIVFLGIAHERSQAKFLLGLLCKTDGVLFRSSCLRAVKDDEALFLDGQLKT